MIIHENRKLKAIPFWQSLLIFGIPGTLMYLGVNYLVPQLIDIGIPLIFAWSACVLVPTIGNAIFILWWYVRKEQPDWDTFKQRFRLEPLERKYWWWIPVTVIVILALNQMLSWTIPILKDIPGFGLAPIVPEIFVDPYETVSKGSENATFMGVALQPENWWLIPFWLLFVVGGVLGEELVWRGYVLPRQEVSYGKWAWLINGLLWNFPFHWYTLSNFLSDLPFYLILPFIVLRIGNTWFAIIVHALMASLAYVIIVPGILN